jgi:alpha-tubulin suppressor-like RCC1 family protein
MRLFPLLALCCLAACSDNGPTTPSAPKALVSVVTTPITGTVGTALPVTVRVVDAEQRGVAGVRISFKLTVLGGTLGDSTAVSNANGDVIAAWTLPSFPGPHSLTASVPGLTALVVPVQVLVGAPASLTILGGDTLTGLVGTAADTVLAVRIADQLGNGIPGRLVTFAPAAGSGTVSVASATTGSNGIAATTWTLGAAAGVQSLTLTTEGYPTRNIAAVALPPSSPRQLAVSPSLSVACRLDGSGVASCWGENGFASLGTGDVQRRIGPTVVSGNRRYVEIASGGAFSSSAGSFCALTTAGALWCWGPTTAYTPQAQIRELTVPTPLARLTMGGAFGCGLDAQGFAWCWGDNAQGQLGVGDNTSRATPVQVSTTLRFRELSAGRTHVCGIARTGEVWCWGANASGQLGVGNTVPTPRPAKIASANRFLAVSAGALHSCAVALDGALFCWGRDVEGAVNGDGLLGEAAVTVPRRVQSGTFFRRVFAGDNATCAVPSIGTALCWGVNSGLRLGTAVPAVQGRHAANPVNGNHLFDELAIGPYNSCGATTSRVVHCWGDSREGALGGADPLFFTAPQAVLGGHTFTQIATGARHSCGLKADGTTWCWGDNRAWQFGAATPVRSLQPMQVPGLPPLTALDAALQSTCGLDATGGVWCWGDGYNGEIGNGTFQDGKTPPSPASVPPMAALSVGTTHACALTPAGTAWCWGGRGGAYGSQTLSLPHVVPTPEPLVAISATWLAACGIGVSGKGYCWNVNTAPDPSAKLMLGGAPVTSVAMGRDAESCFFTVAGAASCRSVPQSAVERIPDPVTFGNFSPHANVRCGTTATGVSSCWGLGDPVPGGIVWIWRQVDLAVSLNICALTPNGAAYCWGPNEEGQLGIGVIAERYTAVPVQVP